MVRSVHDREPRTGGSWRSTAELADHLARAGFGWPARAPEPPPLSVWNHEVIDRPARGRAGGGAT